MYADHTPTLSRHCRGGTAVADRGGVSGLGTTCNAPDPIPQTPMRSLARLPSHGYRPPHCQPPVRQSMHACRRPPQAAGASGGGAALRAFVCPSPSSSCRVSIGRRDPAASQPLCAPAPAHNAAWGPDRQPDTGDPHRSRDRASRRGHAGLQQCGAGREAARGPGAAAAAAAACPAPRALRCGQAGRRGEGGRYAERGGSSSARQ